MGIVVAATFAIWLAQCTEAEKSEH